jgi:plastocyanin
LNPSRLEMDMSILFFRQSLAGGRGRFARRAGALGVAAWLGALGAASADDATSVSVTIKDHRFSPAEPTAPTGKPLTVEITNLDTTPAEFESKPLRVEKIIAGGGKITVQVRALAPGRYRFFDDYHESTTSGFLVVR